QATADGESIVLALDIYEELGLRNLSLKLNSVGCPQCRNDYKAHLKAFLKDKLTRMCEDCQIRYDKNPLRILDCKKDSCRRLTDDAPTMIDFLCPECGHHFEQVQEYL
ncbi:MAG: histidine--tRNA ligase, partial [candidate division KSB1 bacterium]|nr:histidine--tRNA ligase [candidate division KSB1 bacterium]